MGETEMFSLRNQIMEQLFQKKYFEYFNKIKK